MLDEHILTANNLTEHNLTEHNLTGGASVLGLQIPLFSEKKPASNDDFDSESKEWHESEVIMHHTSFFSVYFCIISLLPYGLMRYNLCYVNICYVKLCAVSICSSNINSHPSLELICFILSLLSRFILTILDFMLHE